MRILQLCPLALLSFLGTAPLQAESTISVLLPIDYGKKWNVQIEGKDTPGPKIVAELSNIIQRRGREIPVVVLGATFLGGALQEGSYETQATARSFTISSTTARNGSISKGLVR